MSEIMWEKYGQSGQGVCVQFSIDQKNLHHNFFLGRIQYHPDSPIEKLIHLKQRHEAFLARNEFKFSNYPEALGIISSFYKKDYYRKESEIRLLKFIQKPSEHLHSPYWDEKVLLNWDGKRDEIKYRYILNLEDESCGNIRIKSIYFNYLIHDQIFQYIDELFYKKFKRKVVLQFLQG